MRMALFLPNWVGDAVMATPALRAIRMRFPEVEIVAVLRPYVADVLAGIDSVDRFLFHDPKGPDAQHRGLRFFRRLRKERFDWAVLFPNSLRSAWWAFASGAQRRIGFARDGRSWLLTDALTPKSRSAPHPVIDEYNRIAAHLGCLETTHTMELAVTPDDQWQLERFWQQQDPRMPEPGVVAMNPGGAFGSSKHWPVEHFAELAQRVVDELGRTVLITCGPKEREIARKIVQQAQRSSVVSFAEFPTTIGLVKAAVKQSELLVTTDSGPRHFAAPFGVPVVTLFGPTHIEWSETYYHQAIHLQHEVDCGPCQQRICPLEHHRCMRELDVNRVFRAVSDVIAKSASASALGGLRETWS